MQSLVAGSGAAINRVAKCPVRAPRVRALMNKAWGDAPARLM